MIECRIVPHRADDGPANMAIDEALLASAAASDRAVFRTYTWSVPTLSLGYFQPMALAEAEPRWRDVPIVRRSTGGGALWHDREITYALAIPASHPLARRSAELYRAVHSAIAALLGSLGLVAHRRGEDSATLDGPRPFLCFADRDAEDLVSGRDKLVGSAQRRRARAVLQHGSILLGRSSRTPELPGASDIGPVDDDPDRWAERLAGAIPAALGLVPVADRLSRDEMEEADRLAESVYRDPAWNRKR